jgi:hypothetical protein
MFRKSSLFAVLCLVIFWVPAFSQTTPRDEIVSSLTKLKTLKTYRIKMTMVPGPAMQSQMQMASQMGFDVDIKPMTREIVNPDLQRTTMQMILPSMGLTPGKKPTKGEKQPINMLHPNFIAVSQANKLATYIDCQDCEKQMDDMTEQMLRMQAEQAAKTATMDIIKSAAGAALTGNPVDLIRSIMTDVEANAAASEALAHKYEKKGKSDLGLNQWKCRDRTAAVESSDQTTLPPMKDLTALPDETAGSEMAKVYQFTMVDEGSNREMQIKFYASATTGMPMKFVMTQPEGTMNMEYSDFDAPIKIEIPDCMK